MVLANDSTAKSSPGQSLGHLLKPEKTARIETWIDDMPFDWELKDAYTACEATTEVYKDWLNWSRYSALAWLYKLDRYERRFRTAGLEYHKIPFSLRHSSTLPHGPKIDQFVLTRLSQVLETDRSRTLQSFFAPWIEINKAATEILAAISQYRDDSENVESLKTLHADFELTFTKLAKLLRDLRTGLYWIEKAVAKVAERSDLDGSEVLAVSHSREGSLFRRWIQTFWEVERGLVKSKSEYIEYYVDRVLENGVEKEKYWSMFVEGSDRMEEPSK